MPPPDPAPTGFWLDELPFGHGGNRVPPTGPTVERRQSDWLWQRSGLRLAGASYDRGITVHAPSTVTIDLNRSCSAFDAVAGVDDLAFSPGAVSFAVTGTDGRPLWHSPALRGADAPVPVHVPLAGVRSIRLVVTPVDGFRSAGNLADWADARFTC
ncbi:NPCBM/NEW2 domain-containing protein [Kitasatospora nipponensis]|uniref:NPCBM/NEW2 domain-containing protein n=1 Tax=Kitasatospora nipponensis TaxID=258049 RepID=UPI0031DEAF86